MYMLGTWLPVVNVVKFLINYFMNFILCKTASSELLILRQIIKFKQAKNKAKPLSCTIIWFLNYFYYYLETL